jgi:two-component system sensor histidine kinase CssS
MKKLDISSQLVILIFAILLFASCAFSITTIAFASDIAEKETFNRLSTYVLLVNSKTGEQKPTNFDMNIGYFIKTETINYQHLSKMENTLTVEDIENAANAIKNNNNTNNIEYIGHAQIKINNEKINFAAYTNDNMQTYTIVFTDNAYSKSMIYDIVIKINSLFLIIMLIAIVVIYLWSNGIGRRLRKIQKHILSLPKNNYESTYLDSYEDEVGDLSRSVEEMRSEICENERTKQEMLHNLSHDFKTPIAVIKTYAEAIQDGVEDTNVSATKIIEQAELLKKKVNRLIQYNRLEYFNTDKEFEDIKMAEIINDIVVNYKHQLDNITFNVDLDENVYFKGFSENWYTVVDNIIDNAKRYAKTEIKVVLRENRLRIYNDGDHIDQKFIDSVFKPYEKGSNGQFGLGMSIVQKTVVYFGMNLHVVNEEVGVSFIIDDKIVEK